MSCSDIAKVTGQHLLFMGVGTQGWGIGQFQDVAKFAKAHGVDAILVKTADGGNWWYGGMAGYRQRRDAVKAEGVGVIPYTYSYGNKYNYLDGEISILKAFLQEDGIVCVDMEAEWNSQVGWAQHLCSAIQGTPGIFLVSTWANPNDQSWTGVIQALNPAVSAYLPQQYTNYLASCWAQFGALGAKCVQPTLHMTNEFGANDPTAIAKAAYDQGHTALSVWYHEPAIANPGLFDAILAAFPKQALGGNNVLTQYTSKSADFHGYFTEIDAKHWKCNRNGNIVQFGILGFYQGLSIDGQSLPLPGLPTSPEIYTKINGKDVVVQFYERGILVYDPGHGLDSQPGTKDCYLAKYDDPVIAKLDPNRKP